MAVKKIFFSNGWAFTKEFEQINKWIRQDKDLNLKLITVDLEDYHILSKNKEEFTKKIKSYIKSCDIFLAFNDNAYSDNDFSWCQEEMKIAHQLEKNILIINRWGTSMLGPIFLPYNETCHWNEFDFLETLFKMQK